MYVGGIEQVAATLHAVLAALAPLGELVPAGLVVRPKPGPAWSWALATFAYLEDALSALFAEWRVARGVAVGWRFEPYEAEQLTSDGAGARKFAAAHALDYWRTVRSRVPTLTTQPATVVVVVVVGTASSVLQPGPRERRHIDHLTGAASSSAAAAGASVVVSSGPSGVGGTAAWLGGMRLQAYAPSFVALGFATTPLACTRHHCSPPLLQLYQFHPTAARLPPCLFWLRRFY